MTLRKLSWLCIQFIYRTGADDNWAAPHLDWLVEYPELQLKLMFYRIKFQRIFNENTGMII